MLFSIETSALFRSSANLPAGPALKLHLPLHASSFFSPERRVQWQMVFHSDTFAAGRVLCPPITDILHLLQCLLTGLGTIVYEEHLPQGVYQTTRGLPPVTWIDTNESALLQIFGLNHFRALRKACSERETSFMVQVLPHRQ